MIICIISSLYYRYYCEGGDAIPNPTICPEGNYCPEGSYQPIPCDSGTISSGNGNTNKSDCAPCPAGDYCTANSSKNGKDFFFKQKALNYLS